MIKISFSEKYINSKYTIINDRNHKKNKITLNVNNNAIEIKCNFNLEKSALKESGKEILSLIEKYDMNEVNIKCDNCVNLACGIYFNTWDFKYKNKKIKYTINFISSNFESDANKFINKKSLINAVFYAKNLIAGSSNIITPNKICESIKEFTQDNRLITCTVLKNKEIKDYGMNLLYNVGKGSVNFPCFLDVKYQGNPSSSKNIVLIGKGVTFDSGGVCIKPSHDMHKMKMDMSGAAAIAGFLKILSENALSENDLNINVNFIFPLAENTVGSNSYKPGDVIECFDKQSVEVINTDAEGRLILADGIVYAIQKYKPNLIIDIATLTGAIGIALGSEYAGGFSNNDEFLDILKSNGEEVNEKIWKLPMHDNYDKLLDSDVADMKNITSNVRNAPATIGAQFLQKFAKDTPLIHIDIGGVAWKGDEPTGWGVELLCKAVPELYKKI